MSRNLSSDTIRVAQEISRFGLADGAVDGFTFGHPFSVHISDQSVGQASSSAYTRRTKSSKKSQEKTLEIFQRLNSPRSVVERLQRAKYDRFFGTAENAKNKEIRREAIRKSYNKGGFLTQGHLNLMGMPSPFPYLYKPPAPPFPLPAVEGSMLSVDQPQPSVVEEVPKVNSLNQSQAKLMRYDAKRLDYERKHMPFLDRKGATTSIDTLKMARLKSERMEETIPVAQQAHEWGFKLRGYAAAPLLEPPPPPGPSPPTPVSKPSGTRRTLSTFNSKNPFLLKSVDEMEQESLVEPTRKVLKFDSDFTAEERSRIQDSLTIGRDDTTAPSIWGQGRRVEYVLQPPHILPPNMTVIRAEKMMRLAHHKIAKVEQQFQEFLPRTKFYIHKGKPVPTPAFMLRGNTFNNPNPEMLAYNKVGEEAKPPRKFLLHLEGFENNELSFFIEGNVISVIGEQSKKNKKHAKRIVDSVRLPDDMDLNHILVSRDYTGKVVVEELIECYDDCV